MRRLTLRLDCPPAQRRVLEDALELLPALLEGEAVEEGQVLELPWFSEAATPAAVVRAEPAPGVVRLGTTAVALAPPEPRSPPPAPQQWAAAVAERLPGAEEAALELCSLACDALTGAGAGAGALLHGAPGTGKSALVAALCAAGGVRSVRLDGASVFGGRLGEAEAALRAAFAEARALAPSVLVLEGVEALAPAAGGSLAARVRSQLLWELDQSDSDRRVFALAVTAREAAVHADARMPGRLETAVALRAPTVAARERILARRLAAADARWAAERTPGFVPADLAAVVRDATVAARGTGTGVLGREHVEAALAAARPAALVGLLSGAGAQRPPAVPWARVGGHARAREALLAAVVRPLQEPARYAALGVARPSGVLLHGPSGCGKTLLAHAVGTAVRGCANFLAVPCVELVTAEVGASERRVRDLFRAARDAAPCVLFLDRIESIAPVRGHDSSTEQTFDRLLSCLLVELDGFSGFGGGKVVVVAAAEDRDRLDKAILRPGRLDVHVSVGLPSAEDRAEILGDCGGFGAALAARTEGWTGAQLKAAVNASKMAALRAELEAPGRGEYGEGFSLDL